MVPVSLTVVLFRVGTCLSFFLGGREWPPTSINFKWPLFCQPNKVPFAVDAPVSLESCGIVKGRTPCWRVASTVRVAWITCDCHIMKPAVALLFLGRHNWKLGCLAHVFLLNLFQLYSYYRVLSIKTMRLRPKSAISCLWPVDLLYIHILSSP